MAEAFAGGPQSARRNHRIRLQSRRAQDVLLCTGATAARARRSSSFCTAAVRPRPAYDLGAGWSTLAKRYGFALLMPEQQTSNNANGCFNWFNPEDTARDRGEACFDPADDRAHGRRSQNRSAPHLRHRAFRRRRHDVGHARDLSRSVRGRRRHRRPAVRRRQQCAGSARAACSSRRRARPANWAIWCARPPSHKGPWPKLSVWHGSADRTVNPANANEIVKQWLDVHGLPAAPMSEGDRRWSSAPGLVERGWRDRRRILHHHRHGPWHAAGHRRQ